MSTSFWELPEGLTSADEQRLLKQAKRKKFYALPAPIQAAVQQNKELFLSPDRAGWRIKTNNGDTLYRTDDLFELIKIGDTLSDRPMYSKFIAGIRHFAEEANKPC